MTTARPWITKDRTDGLKNIYHAAGVHDVALCAKPDDADLIVKAVNDYDRLRRGNAAMLEALKSIDNAGITDHCVCDSDNTPDDPCRVCYAANKARVAIRQAETNELKRTTNERLDAAFAALRGL